MWHRLKLSMSPYVQVYISKLGVEGDWKRPRSIKHCFFALECLDQLDEIW